MTEFTFCNMMRGDSDFEVHRKGCRYVARKRLDMNGTWTVEADNADAAVEAEVAIMAADDCVWPVEAFRILGCAR